MNVDNRVEKTHNTRKTGSKRAKVKSVTSFGKATFQPFSHPSTFNFHWSLCYSRKLEFGSHWGNYFTPSFVCSQQTAPRYIKLAQTLPSQGTNSHIGRVEPRIFLCPKNHVWPVYYSNQGPFDLQANTLPLDHRVPKSYN